MLSTLEFQYLATVINKLEADGQDVRALKELMARERARVNALMAADLIDYLPITKDIMTKIDDVDYGGKNLKVKLSLFLPREVGVFDKNSAPELFESILANAVNECLKKLKDEYVEECNNLKTKVEQDMITASVEKPIILIIGTMTLYVSEGQIDKSLSWQVDSYNDVDKTIMLKSGLIIKTLTISSGTYIEPVDGNKNVVISQ